VRVIKQLEENTLEWTRSRGSTSPPLSGQCGLCLVPHVLKASSAFWPCGHQLDTYGSSDSPALFSEKKEESTYIVFNVSHKYARLVHRI
jgi:hypothetical protein